MDCLEKSKNNWRVAGILKETDTNGTVRSDEYVTKYATFITKIKYRADHLGKGPPNIGEEAGCDFPKISTFQSDKKFQICQFSFGKNPAYGQLPNFRSDPPSGMKNEIFRSDSYIRPLGIPFSFG